MVLQKRKYTREEGADDDLEDSDGFEEVAGDDSDDEVDLSTILSNKRPRRGPVEAAEEDEDEEDDLKEFLQETMAKRDKKSGTEAVKKLRGGKGKLVKGEVGGGSFQNMGSCRRNCSGLSEC